jgi:hypothetical protein
MRKVLIFSIILALIGCATGDRISKLKTGMLEDRATNIMGEPDRVEQRGEYAVFRYKDRLIGSHTNERADYYVIVKNGLVVDYGIGEIRLELPPPEEKCNTRLGTIGVVPALFLPKAKVRTPGGWAKEGAKSARKAVNGVAQVAAGGGELGVCIFIVAAPFAAGIGCLVGIPQGLKQAVPDDEVEEMRGVITNAIGELKIQETISVYLSKTVVEFTDCRLDLLNGKGPHDPDEELNYRFLERDGIDHVLEVSVRSVGFKSGPGGNPDIFFFMTVHTRFVGAGDEEEVFSKDLHWVSDKSFKLADYVDNNSRLLQEEIDRSCEEISERIAGRLNWEH